MVEMSMSKLPHPWDLDAIITVLYISASVKEHACLPLQCNAYMLKGLVKVDLFAQKICN